MGVLRCGLGCLVWLRRFCNAAPFGEAPAPLGGQLAASRTQPGEWVIVTREQTGGNAQYDGLQPSWHVTLATLAHLPNGYSISQWLPQN